MFLALCSFFLDVINGLKGHRADKFISDWYYFKTVRSSSYAFQKEDEENGD